MKPPLLFLVHRIPFPPNKGDKIRSFNLLRHLSDRYDVHLGCFIDDPEDAGYERELARYCASTCCVTLDRQVAKLRGLTGLLSGQPLSCPYYYSHRLKRWTEDVIISRGIERVLVFSSQMAQYVMGNRFIGLRRIMDFVDVDSDKWRQYAPTKRWPMSWLYRREAESLLAFERRVANEFDRSLFVSSKEMQHFAALSGVDSERLSYANNGVDTTYFDSSVDCRSPYPSDVLPMVFVGAMDYWPNEDAVRWFAERVLPTIVAGNERARLFIVGSNPTPAVRALAEAASVEVTGRVDDVRPYLKFACVAVAPLQIARGIQNKVLESMAMARPTVVTTPALEGIAAENDRDLICRDDPAAFADAVLDLLDNPDSASKIGANGRIRVCSDYGWENNLNRFSTILAG